MTSIDDLRRIVAGKWVRHPSRLAMAKALLAIREAMADCEDRKLTLFLVGQALDEMESKDG